MKCIVNHFVLFLYNNIYTILLILFWFRGIAGRKQVYSKKTENGDIYCMSVEELALSHYKNRGFLNGDLYFIFNNLNFCDIDFMEIIFDF